MDFHIILSTFLHIWKFKKYHFNKKIPKVQELWSMVSRPNFYSSVNDFIPPKKKYLTPLSLFPPSHSSPHFHLFKPNSIYFFQRERKQSHFPESRLGGTLHFTIHCTNILHFKGLSFGSCLSSFPVCLITVSFYSIWLQLILPRWSSFPRSRKEKIWLTTEISILDKDIWLLQQCYPRHT